LLLVAEEQNPPAGGLLLHPDSPPPVGGVPLAGGKSCIRQLTDVGLAGVGFIVNLEFSL